MTRGSNYIGKMLRKIRMASKLTKRGFAQKLGVNHSYYIKCENGTKPPSKKIIDGIGKIAPGIFKRQDDGQRNYFPVKYAIHKKLKLLRKLKMMPSKLVSYYSGIPYSRYRRIESGVCAPTRKEISLIAEAMDISPSVFRDVNFAKALKSYLKVFEE